MAKFIPISHTSLKTYTTCPMQFYEKYIAKSIPFTETPEMRRGNEIHRAIELNIKEAKPLPPDMTYLQKYVDFVEYKRGAGAKAYAERQLAVDRDLVKCSYRAWDKKFIGGKDDLTLVTGTTARSLDWKTGKLPREFENQQLYLQSVLVFAEHPEVEAFSGSFVYTEHDVTSPPVRVRRGDGLPQQVQDDIGRYEEALKFDDFPPTKNGLCQKWCPVTKCMFNGRYSK